MNETQTFEKPKPRRIIGLLVGLCAGFICKELGLRGIVSYWGPQAPFIVAFAILGAAFWRTRLRWVMTTATVLLAMTWLAVAAAPVSQRLAQPLIRRDPLASADAIFVLSSNIQLDGDPSPSALARATRGLELLGEGQAPRLLLSELGPRAGSYTDYVRKSGTRMGMQHMDAITSVGVVGNTHDEAVAVAELFAKNGWKKLILVTSPTHSRRSAATFERAGVPEVISIPASETLVDIEDLDHPDDRTFAFGMIVHEWVGVGFYRLRGWMR